MEQFELNYFPKIRRLPLGKIPQCKAETIMPPDDVKRLFNGQRIIIEEKFNGTAKMFKADNGRFTILAEDMLKYKSGLTKRYKIAARYAIWDIFDNRRNVFASFVEKEDIFQEMRNNNIFVSGKNNYNFFLVTLLGHGCSFKLEDMPKMLEIKSRYVVDPETGTPEYMEGIVVKPAREMYLVEYESLVGKLLRNEYLYGTTRIKNNYLRMPIRYNNINPIYGIDDQNFWGRKTKPDC